MTRGFLQKLNICGNTFLVNNVLNGTRGFEMQNLRHVPSEEGNLRIDRLISSKFLIYIRLMSTHPPSNSPHPQVSELTTCTLTGLSLYSLPMETACPKPSMHFPVAYCSIYFLNWCFSTLPKQTQFPVLELASVYLLFRLEIGWEENQGPRGRRKLSSVQSTLKKSEWSRSVVSNSLRPHEL